MNTCKNKKCGKEYDPQETIRTSGDAYWVNRFCSPQCYTESEVNNLKEKRTPYKRQGDFIHQKGRRDQLICSLLGDRDYKKEHGDFIVRACNSHDDLIEACEALVKSAVTETEADLAKLEKAFLLAKEALAKAKGA